MALNIKQLKPATGSRNQNFDNMGGQREAGVALLTILLLVVAITVVAGSMVATQKIHLRQYELLLVQDQTMHSIRAAQKLATALIIADDNVNDTDSMQDAWAQSIPITPMGNQAIAMTIEDASSLFNINNLYHDDVVDDTAVSMFAHLLTTLELSPTLAYAVLDWQDPDSDMSAEGGAEADAYIDLMSGGRADKSVIANQPFLTVDELLSVRGFTPEIVDTLRPFITAAPYYLPINVNTASPIVLSAALSTGQADEEGVSSPVSLSLFDGFVQQRDAQPVDDIDNLFSQLPWSQVAANQQDTIKPLLAVESGAFKVIIDVRVDGNATMIEADKSDGRHRYATTMIAKVNERAQSKDEDSQNNTVATTTADPIQAYGTRLWTYRPSL